MTDSYRDFLAGIGRASEAVKGERDRELAAELARMVIQCVRTQKLDVAIDDIAAALASVRAETVEQCAKACEEAAEYDAYPAIGRAHANFIRALIHTGETDAR